MLPLLRMKEFGRDSSEFSGLGRSPLGLALKKVRELIQAEWKRFWSRKETPKIGFVILSTLLSFCKFLIFPQRPSFAISCRSALCLLFGGGRQGAGGEGN